MEDYIREWSISPSEIVIEHTKGKEPSVVNITGVMPAKYSWDRDYFLIYFSYWLIADKNFIEIIGDEDRSSSFHELEMDGSKFSYSFKLKNVDNLPAGTTKTLKLTHKIETDRPAGINSDDDDFEKTLLFSKSINVKVLIKEPAETVTPTQPATPTNPSTPAPIDPTSPVLPKPSQPITPMKPVQPATPTQPVQPKIAPEAMDTDSILLYAGLFVAALVLIKE